MAAGDRNTTTGKPTDIVKHHAIKHGDKAVCGRRNPGYISLGITADVTCRKCLKKLKLGHHGASAPINSEDDLVREIES